MDGHSSILKNVTGDWTVYCAFCAYEEKYAVPIGNTKVEDNKLINEHPLGNVTLFDANTFTFFSGLRTVVAHCERRRRRVCWRCRKPCIKPFCARCVPYIGDPNERLIVRQSKVCAYCKGTLYHGICKSCRLLHEDDQVMKTF